MTVQTLSDDKFTILSGQAVLSQLASVTGGTVLSPTSEKNLGELLASLALELHNHYMIGLKPVSSVQEDKYHRLKVQVTLPPGGERITRLVVRSREGYYTNATSYDR